MIIHLFLVIFLFSIGSCKQIYMATVFRHGARYPLNNIYDGKQTAPFHGQLTSVGLRQQYLLGNYIQNDYMINSSLINKTLHPRQVEIFTLGAQRCIESAYAHALGLFSFYQGQQIDTSINSKLLEPPFENIYPDNLKSEQAPSNFALDHGFQPVPIMNGDLFFPKCDNQANIYIKRGQVIAKIVAQLQAEYSIFTEEMARLFKLTLQQSNIGGLAELYDTLTCDNFLGRPLPTKFTDKDYQKLSFIQRYLFTLVNEQHPARIFNAPFINHMISNMQNLIKRNFGVKKLSAYSAHDSNVVPLLAYYNLTSSECLKRQFSNQTVHGNCAVPIPFASNLIFELHQDDKNTELYFVKIRYNGKYYDLCGQNKAECQFKQFSQRSISNLMNFDKECAKPKVQQQILILQQ